MKKREHRMHLTQRDNNLEDDGDKKEYTPQRVTRALIKQKMNRGNHVGKLVWGYCSGWWPGEYIESNYYLTCSDTIRIVNIDLAVN